MNVHASLTPDFNSVKRVRWNEGVLSGFELGAMMIHIDCQPTLHHLQCQIIFVIMKRVEKIRFIAANNDAVKSMILIFFDYCVFG